MTCGGDGLAELLERAGLETVGDGRAEDVLPPRAAWRSVIAYEAEPAVAVLQARPDLVAELNAQWHRLAVERGVIGEDGVFLVDVAASHTCTCSGPRQWTRVRLTEKWDLAGVLGDRPGRPEFVTASTDGDALLGVTSQEYEIWLVAVDCVKEQQEEAARAEARETPEEREAAWDSLVRRFPATERLCQVWAESLAFNEAADEEVLLRLVGLTAHHFWRGDLPAVVIDAAVAHPSWQVRGALADIRQDLTAEQWDRLLLDERDPKHLFQLAMLTENAHAGLTNAGYEKLATAPDAQVRIETARLPGLPARLATALAADPDPRVRAGLCRFSWPHLDRRRRESLLADPEHQVREAAALRHHQDRPMPRAVFDTLLHLARRAAEECRLTRDLAEHLATHDDPGLRLSLASNPHLDPDLLAALADDEDDDVRLQVSVRPDLTEEQRAAVRVDIDPSGMRGELAWVRALHDDPEAMRRCAASSHLLVRSSAARAKRLPPDAVELLGRDEDRVVRLFLAESCDDAPADMLLEVWGWWDGSLSHPGRPRTHPNFPRQGLLRYADDPNPRMRQLALDDPESTPELVEHLSRDPNEDVRWRAATDPRLSAAAAVRLLDDPRERVWRAAARCPRLPARTLVRLLRDSRTAGEAARNPALPLAVMRWMTEPEHPVLEVG
ncbi:PE-PGRS family protein [Streptomyces sp. ISL-11]|uniref:PE-PGRS family protein n=1 Tax=Streptomyces sp. ISL-11 TaxID=2819174 RepID=UPI001BE4EECB|nr:PE-PGRS family protein [Streptomyces sp. ISL-11]MBT2386627.1 PE-PGRS family protein [Streptomyces sp. ISL-11]